MIVIESGGTKSTWVFHDSSGKKTTITSVGLHPQELSNKKKELILKLVQAHQLEGTAVYFFGAGCESKEAKKKVIHFLKEFSLKVKQVETDIYAACVAHLGSQAGFVGILGTGAVAAYFDGEKVVQQTSGLGYLLGDEGSGFDIGKRFLQSYFRNEFPQVICTRIAAHFNHQSVLHRIYEPDGRMFVAGLSRIVYEFRSEPLVQEILKNSFRAFCKTALQPLPVNQPINFIGSIAYYFESELGKALLAEGFQLGNIEKEAVHKVFAFLSKQ
jgi:N-acetylglucosamine kinase-like BadF-type ATPase